MILIVKDYGMSLFTVNNIFYLFDPHSRNDQGYRIPNGRAVLVVLNSIPDVCSHLRNLSTTLTQQPLESVRFEINSVQVDMLNSQPKDHYKLSSSSIDYLMTCKRSMDKHAHINEPKFEESKTKKLSKRDKLKLKKQADALRKQVTRQTVVQNEKQIRTKTCQKVEVERKVVGIQNLPQNKANEDCHIVDEFHTTYIYNPINTSWHVKRKCCFSFLILLTVMCLFMAMACHYKNH